MNSSDLRTEAPLASALRKLEFSRVLERVARLAQSEPGRAAVESVVPSTDLGLIQRSQDEVTAAKEILIEDHAAPLSSFHPILASLRKARVANQGLAPVELTEIALVLRTSREMHQFLRRRVERFGVFARFLESLIVDKVVEYNIGQAIDEQGGVRDSASRELKRIRQDMVASREALQRRLGQILRKVSEQDLTQDEIITTRDGRLVIPVKSEFKSRVAGFIHSTSASGATVYIEPTETLELNNGLRELQIGEQREIQRILLELTRQVSEIAEPLGVSFASLTELDVIFAKARYSIEIIGVPPNWSETPRIRIRDGRHPVLLQRHERTAVVPLSLDLGEDATTLVITGPNAGGKTVALKTVGLLTLCAQAGLHVPAASDTTLYPFQSFFVDIGDDQSLEQDLSTFSSHLVRLRETLAEASAQSLVLIDEIGSGTDPDEGGALAMAVLETLTRDRVMTIATTHQGTLKVFAHNTAGVVNGSMEFDQASLSPTFKFLHGVPGSSFALELAERIGFPAAVLALARAARGSEKVKLESLLAELERMRQDVDAEQRQLREEVAKAGVSASEYASKLRVLQQETRQIRAKAVREAAELLEQGRRSLEQAIKEVRESSGDRERIKTARASFQASHDSVTKLREEEDSAASLEPAGPPSPGDRVRLRSGTEIGELVAVDGSRATVLWGTLRAHVRTAELVRVAAPAVAAVHAAQGQAYEIPEAQREVDVRGLLGDEAVAEVERALERAFVAGLHRVDIIHGKGTGALRKRVTEYLKHAQHVTAFRLGEWNEGGTGVTVVELGD